MEQKIDHENRKHALLSASAAHRWMECTQSARLEERLPDQPSAVAQEGTLAHEICEGKLRQMLGQPTKHPEPKPYDEEMYQHADSYVAYIAEIMADSTDTVVLVEQQLDYSKYAPEGFGTADCVIASGDTLHVVDFKYGQGVFVDAVDNPQMKLYALGALELFPSAKEVVMHIFQPRRANISACHLLTEDLLEWAETQLKPKAKQAWSGEGEFKCGEHCQFCKAKTTCRARAEHNLELAELDFAEPPLLTDDEIEDVLPKLEGLQAWAKSLFEYAEGRALDGKRWRAFKLVESRTNRKVADEKKVIETLKQTYPELIVEKLKPISVIEKTLTTDEIRLQLGEDWLTKPKGKPTLVPETDKRAEYTTADSDFGGEV